MPFSLSHFLSKPVTDMPIQDTPSAALQAWRCRENRSCIGIPVGPYQVTQPLLVPMRNVWFFLPRRDPWDSQSGLPIKPGMVDWGSMERHRWQSHGVYGLGLDLVQKLASISLYLLLPPRSASWCARCTPLSAAHSGPPTFLSIADLSRRCPVRAEAAAPERAPWDCHLCLH